MQNVYIIYIEKDLNTLLVNILQNSFTEKFRNIHSETCGGMFLVGLWYMTWKPKKGTLPSEVGTGGVL